jgi:hypothetical protein
MMLKIVELAPMPSANDSVATSVNAGRSRRVRKPCRMSWRIVVIATRLSLLRAVAKVDASVNQNGCADEAVGYNRRGLTGTSAH